MIIVQGIDHLVLRVRDLAASLHFYVDLLGCPVERRQDEIGLVQLRAGAQLIDLVTLEGRIGRAGGAGPGREGRNVDHFCLRVDALDEPRLRLWLERQGVTVDSFGSRNGADGEGPSLYLFDPDGNELELKGPPWPKGLHEALDEAQGYAPYYPSGSLRLFNHLPMVLGALGRLGATTQAYRLQLDHWRRLGVPASALPESLPTLEEALPRLLLSAEQDAFHAAIRMAYALQSGHAAEQRAALAAWVAKVPDVRAGGQGVAMAEPPSEAQAQAEANANAAPPDLYGALSLREILARVRADDRLQLETRSGSLIVTRMRAAQALPGFNDHAQVPHLSLDDLAEASLAISLATHDFTALHLVTGTHALRVLIDAAQARELSLDLPRILRNFWRALLAAYTAVGRPEPAWDLVHAGHADEADWQWALPSLFESLNDHRIKLADAAREEWRHRGWPGYALCLEPQGAAQ